LADFLSPSMEVAAALAAGQPIVALESSVWVQGLAWPANWETAQQVDQVIREEGAIPAVIWVDEGLIHFGLGMPQLEALCKEPRGHKLNVSDLPGALATKAAGATTVSASLRAAEMLGIKVFATGGVGGVHRGWNEHPDLSADLLEMARTPLVTVCAGVKCVLDVEATLEALETLAIPVYRYQTDTFPEFFSAGMRTYGWRVENVEEICRAYQLGRQMLGRGCLVVQEPPTSISPKVLHKWLHKGLAAVPKGGKEVTPFLLQWLAKNSNGQTVEVNKGLLVSNARLAAQVAVALKNG
jgi:pseudouridine-5'-phosphate glycosidase